MPRKARRRVWGSGTVWQRGQRWWIQWREGGRRRAKSYADEATARKVLAKILADIATGKAGLPPDPTEAPTLAELAKPWLEGRERSHRSGGDDRSRWRTHLGPAFGKMRPAEVDAIAIRRFIEIKLAKGLAPGTVGNCVRLLSVFFGHVMELGHATTNPVAGLPRNARKLYRSNYDTRSTPFLQTLADVRRVFLALPEPVNVAFACGAFAGLRTGEVLGLSWEDIDLAARRIHVKRQMQDGRLCGLKDDEPRIVMLQNSLAPILAAWRLKTGGEGLLFKPKVADRGGRPDLGTAPAFMRPSTLIRHLREALKTCGLPPLTWYSCTRHTFASLFVLGGGSLEMLRTLMGHSSVTTTERYSHLRPDLFAEASFHAMDVDLSKPAGDVVALAPVPGKTSSRIATTQQDKAEKQLSLIA
ncbi:MAG: site-specific integrase [Polyangia bacterium]